MLTMLYQKNRFSKKHPMGSKLLSIVRWCRGPHNSEPEKLALENLELMNLQYALHTNR